MAFCENCGTQLQPESIFCVNCGNKILNQPSEVSVPQSYVDNSFVELSENEVKVKTYHFTTFKRPKGEGYLTVTNKRVVFHGHGSSAAGKSKLSSELLLENVSGINTYYGYGLMKIFIVLGIICTLLSLLLFPVFSNSFFDEFLIIPIFLLVVGILFFVFSKTEVFHINIYSSGANGTPIGLSSGFASMVTGQGAMTAIKARKTDETELMMNELGAIVLDFKTMGDHAIEKWSNSSNKKDKANSQRNETKAMATNVNDEEFFK